jgi:hypothetical protein
MDSSYLLQLDYRQDRPDHPDCRQLFSNPFSSDDSQFWSYSYPTQSSQFPRYLTSQCDPQSDTTSPFVYDPPTEPIDDLTSPSRLGIFDISAMHAPVGSEEPWGSQNEGEPPAQPCHVAPPHALLFLYKKSEF